MKNGKELEEDIQLMSQPEEIESFLSDLGVGEDELEGNEQPEGNVGPLVASKVELFVEVEKGFLLLLRVLGVTWAGLELFQRAVRGSDDGGGFH